MFHQIVLLTHDQNIEHARTLLLSLEHSAASLPTKSKKSAMQTDLQQKRDVLKQLNQRLDELTQADIDDDSDGSVDSEDENEDNYPSYAPHRKADDGIEVTSTSGQGSQALEDAAQILASEVRRRAGMGSSEGASATGNSLFSSKPTTTTTDTTEATLSHDRSEQEGLTNSLLEMAKQLKQQSIHFGRTLESDTGVLDRAVSALDTSSQGMDAAGQRIGTLRRMTEGKGWWDRMKLYAMISGLWVAIFLVGNAHVRTACETLLTSYTNVIGCTRA
jgi:hypothetical protein